MARISKGWRLRRRTPGGVLYVRFAHGGSIERSTGCRGRKEAAEVAARIYATHVTRGPARRGKRGAGGPLEELIAKWLISLGATHDAGTVETWELYGRTHWLTRFASVADLTQTTLEAYRDERLGVVKAETVRKELSAMRVFLRWLGIEVPVPSVPKRTTGTAFAKRRRGTAPLLTPDEAHAVIDALPEWSASKKVERFPIRARFLVAYETTLRPSTLDALRAPTHYRRGSSTILLTRDVDKARYGREVPLSLVARQALDRVCPKEGAIFGKHDYREHLKAAAEATLPPETAARFAGVHLRSARITHLLESTGNLPGVQYLAGHKLASTTALYAKPSLRAAIDVLNLDAKQGAPKNSANRRGAKR